MYHFSDSDSKDSDDGIRFKTDSTRNKQENGRRHTSKNISSERQHRHRSHSRSRSASRRRRRSKSPRRRSSDRAKRPNRSPSTGNSKSSTESSRRREKDTSRRTRPPTETRKVLETSPKDKPEESKQTEYIGPQLPPHLVQQQQPKEDRSVDYIGPQLPPQLKKTDCEEAAGPQLPPHLSKPSESPSSSSIGPTLPPHLRQKLAAEISLKNDEMMEDVDSEEDEIYGPIPAGSDAKLSQAHIALEERALQIKMDQLEPDQDKQPSREEWMLELPEVKAVANLGLASRQFRSKARPDMSDRSSWTDTPEEKAKKKHRKHEEVDLKKQAELKEIRKRDREQEAMSKKHKKKQSESLLEMHQNKMKKKKKEESGSGERRPFSRDIDLKVNRFDEAQKKAVLKKAQLLDDRFSRGQSKFL